MRKSNIIIIAILVIASVLFLWLWQHLGFNLVHNLDLILTIVWWIVIIGICVAIHLIEKRRQEAIRTIFVANGVLYNSEIGIVRLTGTTPDDYVTAMFNVLNSLQYKSNARPDTSQTRMRFNYIVHSSKFSRNGRDWQGNVVVVRPHSIHDFATAKELTDILATA